MELNELTSVIERSMKTISSSVTRNLARTAAYEVMNYYEEKANSRIKWTESLDNPQYKTCFFNGLPVASIEKNSERFEFKTYFPVGPNDKNGSGSKENYEDAQKEVEKLLSTFLQKLF